MQVTHDCQACSGQTWSVPDDTALHILSVHDSGAADGRIDVTVGCTAVPVVLALSAHDAVRWVLHRDPGAEIQRILVNEHQSLQTVEGDEGVPIEAMQAPPAYCWDHCHWYDTPADDLVAAVEARTGLATTSFHGCYSASRFELTHTCTSPCNPVRSCQESMCTWQCERTCLDEDLCGDGHDNNCDGQTDEDCPCAPPACERPVPVITHDCGTLEGSIMDPIGDDAALHVLSIYGAPPPGNADSSTGTVDVYVGCTARPVTLVLNAHERTDWVIHREPGALVARVLYAGWSEQTVLQEAGASVDGLCIGGYFETDDPSSGLLQEPPFLRDLEQVVGTHLTTFHGCDHASTFRISHVCP